MLRAIADDLWELDHPFRLLGLFVLGHRMVVVRQPNGGLILHSPVPVEDGLVAALDALGPVATVLVPSTMHNLWLAPWAERYPDARFLAVPGFAAQYPSLPVHGELSTATAIEGLRCRTMDGMPKINECVVLHEASRTLIVADLMFHFPTAPTFATRMLLRMVGAYGRPAVSRIFRSFVKDRGAMRGALDDVLGWEFDRIVVGHGVNIDGGPERTRAALASAYAWMT